MRFFGTVWRVLVGIKDGLVLIFMLIFFGLLYAALTVKPYSGTVREGALLLNLSGGIVEQPAEQSPMDVLSGSPLGSEHRLRDLVHGLDKAASDKRIKAVALDLDGFGGGGQSAIANVADALERVKKAGKPVVAYATAYTDDSYQLAAHASEIWLNPLGGVVVAGPGGSNLYFKGLLDKLGVTANVYRVGTYKAAVEPVTRNDMSPEAREASQALAGSLWETWQQDVARARPKAQIAAYAAAPAQRLAAAEGDMAKAALNAGLVDKLGDRFAFEKEMARLAGEDDKEAFARTSLKAWTEANPASESGGEIGILTVAGTILDGTAGPGTAGGDTIAEALERGLRDGNLKALVVRIDSPGGSVTGSERIRQAVLEAKAQGLPVVISMGSVAASGGYWIATAGDRIFAEPSTITGSIGVFGVLPSFEGALQKLGIGADGVKTTPLSGEPDLLEGISPEASQMLQMGVENTYRRFLSVVSKSRGLPVQQVDRIAQGRVWDGGTARQLKLVDQFGSLGDAVAEAARRADIDPEDATVTYLEKEPDFFTQMLASFGEEDAGEPPADAYSLIAAQPQQLLIRALEDARQILAGPAIQARCLECPSSGAVRMRDPPSLGAWLLGLVSRG
jgi:protease-4